MYSQFELYLGFGLTQVDEINSGTIHVVCPTQPIACMLMHWRLYEPVHQQACYWHPKLEYSVSSIRRVKTKTKWEKILHLHTQYAQQHLTNIQQLPSLHNRAWLWSRQQPTHLPRSFLVAARLKPSHLQTIWSFINTLWPKQCDCHQMLGM